MPARLMSAPRPSDVLAAVSGPTRPASPRRCGEYGLRSHGLRHLGAPWGCHMPCPGTGSEASLRWAPAVLPRWRQGSPPVAWCHGRLNGPPCSSTRRLRLVPALRGQWGWGRLAPPNRALPKPPSAACHSHCPPPSSSHASINIAHMLENTPRLTQCWNVRWIVLLLPNSLGKWFHWQPLRIRKIIPLSICRWSARLRPVALGGCITKSTARISSHRSFGTSQMVSRGRCSSIYPSSTPLEEVSTKFQNIIKVLG